MATCGLIGYGYTAKKFAKLLNKNNFKVWGTSRSPNDNDNIKFEYAPIQKAMQTTSHLLVSVPPTAQGIDPAFNIIEKIISQQEKQVKWLVYLSSTGVYGDHNGNWVNEDSNCNIKTNRQKNRINAELKWLSLTTRHNIPVMIFRLSGIYGPGRNAVTRIQGGKNFTIYKPGQYFSRIHVDDICTALLNSINKPIPGAIFNLADDFPCSNHEVDLFAASIIGKKIETQELEQAQITAMTREFFDSNKRVSNHKLKQLLLPKLKFPTYREGLNEWL